MQQEDLGGGSGAAIVSLGTLVFAKTATFKDTVDVSSDRRCGQYKKEAPTTNEENNTKVIGALSHL